MEKFKSGRMPIVVATDVAARGLGNFKKNKQCIACN